MGCDANTSPSPSTLPEAGQQLPANGPVVALAYLQPPPSDEGTRLTARALPAVPVSRRDIKVLYLQTPNQAEAVVSLMSSNNSGNWRLFLLFLRRGSSSSSPSARPVFPQNGRSICRFTDGRGRDKRKFLARRPLLPTSAMDRTETDRQTPPGP